MLGATFWPCYYKHMNTFSLAKSLPKYLAVIFSAVIIGSVTLITSSLIHADAKASTNPGEQISEADVRADEPEESKNTADEANSTADNSSDTPENSGTSQEASSDSTSQMNVADSNAGSNNSQASVDAPASQTNSDPQNQTSPSDDSNKQQVAQTDETSTPNPEPATDVTNTSEKDKETDPIRNPQLGYIPGVGENGGDDGEGDDPDKNPLNLIDYYHQGQDSISYML